MAGRLTSDTALAKCAGKVLAQLAHCMRCGGLGLKAAHRLMGAKLVRPTKKASPLQKHACT